MKPCPTCSNPLANAAMVCNGCGWESPRKSTGKPVDASWWQCVDEYQGRRCAKAGSLSESTLGTGPWYCNAHHPPFRFRVGFNGGPMPVSVRNSLPRKQKPHDFEAEAERLALQLEEPL